MSRFSEIMDDLVAMGAEGFREFQKSLPEEWIEGALVATGKASIRRRKITAEQAVWLVLGMAMFADRSIENVVEHLGLVIPGVTSLTSGAIPQARYRLGERPMEWLFRKVAGAWANSPGLPDYHGLSLRAVDGVCMRVQDSDENFEHFGKPWSRDGDAGYPQLRMAVLMNLSTRFVEDVAFGPYNTSEQKLAGELWRGLSDNSLTILDRGYVDYGVFSELVESGINRHLLVRMRSNIKPVPLESLPDGSILAELRAPKDVVTANPGIQKSLRIRIIHYQHPGGEESRVFTTLVDHKKYPAQELIVLYHERWEIELGFDEIKTHMLDRKECLRSKKPKGVEQEVWGLLLLYNMVRREMLLAAQQHNLEPKRISFRSSLLWMRNFWLITAWLSSPGTIARQLSEFRSTLDVLILPPRRSERRYPRHVKIKMSKFERNRGRRNLPDAKGSTS